MFLALELESVFKEKAKENLSIAGSSYSPKEGLPTLAKVTEVKPIDTHKKITLKMQNI